VQIIDRYIFTKFLSSFFYALILFMAIIVVFDFSENVSLFMNFNISWVDIVFKYYLNWIPQFFNLFIPLFTFISTIWFTSKLSSNNEIVAILSGGVNFYRLLVPYFVGALCIVLLSFLMSNMVVPRATLKFENFRSQYMMRYTKTTTNFHIRNSANSYIYVDRWNVKEQKGYTFSYDELGNSFVKYRITAREIVYDDSLQVWRLYDYKKRLITHTSEKIVTGITMDTMFNITPLDLSKDEQACEMMTFREVLKYIRDDKDKGGGMAKYYIIQANKRIANSLGIFIMTLLGVTIAFRKNRRGVGVNLFFGVALVFIFVFLQQISTVFSTEGGLSPAWGAWMPNIIYAFICAFMVKACPK
jgi:lipopolysaccharide export system permease protein